MSSASSTATQVEAPDFERALRLFFRATSTRAAVTAFARAHRAHALVVHQVREPYAQQSLRSVEPGTHRPDRNAQANGYLAVLEPVELARAKRFAERARQLGDRCFDLREDVRAIETLGENGWSFVARPIASGEILVTPATHERARLVQAAMQHRAHEPTAQVTRRLRLRPQAHERLLHGVPCEVVAAQHAARDGVHARNVLREIERQAAG